MTTKLNNQFFFVAPLEVVKVTKDNLQEAAEWCGGKVAQVESRKVAGRMDSYVWVPTPKGTQISWAFPGMYITRRIVVTLKNELTYTYQVYRRDYFEKNYFGLPNEAVDKTWERAEKERQKAARTKKVAQTQPEPGTVERQAVETDTSEVDSPSVDLVQSNRDKIRKVEDVQLPDDAVSLGEAVALVEEELGGEVIDVFVGHSKEPIMSIPVPAPAVEVEELPEPAPVDGGVATEEVEGK